MHSQVIEVDVLLSGTKMYSRNKTTCWRWPQNFCLQQKRAVSWDSTTSIKLAYDTWLVFRQPPMIALKQWRKIWSHTLRTIY